MEYETGFLLINLGVLPAWLLLFFAPRSRLTKKLVHSGAYPVLYGILYLVLMIRAMFFGVAAEGGGGESAAAVAAFFSHPNGVLIGWIHYLVFDMFVGAWISRDAARRTIAHWKIVPCLALTFLFGPVGLLLYMGLRKFGASATTDLTEA